jgi:hypothetical protein
MVETRGAHLVGPSCKTQLHSCARTPIAQRKTRIRILGGVAHIFACVFPVHELDIIPFRHSS